MKPENEGYYWVARVRDLVIAGRETQDVEELIAYYDPENPEKPWRADGKQYALDEFQQVNKYLGTSAGGS